jgi:ribosomal protein S18 acetylase RimI-like enzyme
MPPIIRPATISDAIRLSRFAAAAFRDAFAHDNTPEDMARYVAESFTPERQAGEIADPEGVVLLAESEEVSGSAEAPELLGYAHLVSAQAPESVIGQSPIELSRFYVSRALHGKGVAQTLMDATLDAARGRGADVVWLGVWERNSRAVAFYRKYGFERVGEQVFMLGADRQTDWVLARPLRENVPQRAHTVR